MTILVRSTTNCPNTRRILFGLEELGVSYRCELVDDGVFTREWGSPGPTITDGDITTIEAGAILRHLCRRERGQLWPTSLAAEAEADRLFDFQSRRISRAIENKDVPELLRLLAFIEARLAASPWLLGDDFTMVDVFYSVFAFSRARMPFLPNLPHLSAYLDRMSARPAFERAVAARLP